MKKILARITMVMILSTTAGFAVADDYGNNEMKSWDHKGMEKKMVMGRHSMSGTLESVDLKTGWIKLKTSEGEMTVHFPSQSIKDLKSGDMITVHLSFSMGEEMMKGGEMMDENMKK